MDKDDASRVDERRAREEDERHRCFSRSSIVGEDAETVTDNHSVLQERGVYRL